MESIFGSLLASAGIGGSNLSLCTEGNWSALPAGPIFRAVKELETYELKRLLKHEKYKRHINDLDGDGASALHVLVFSHEATMGDAENIVKAFKNAGANLDIRASGMMRSETPLHIAACYGHYAVIKALIDAGAKVDMSDDLGRTTLSRVEENMTKQNSQQSVNLIREVLQKEKGSPSNRINAATTAQARRGEELRKNGNQYFGRKEWEKAADMYTKSLACYKDHRTHGNRAAAFLNDAIDRITNGKPGYRQLFKQTYMEASNAVELEKTYEKGWFRMARGYLGFRELPRAKKALLDGSTHCPDSKHLAEMWALLDVIGVPDHVADHESEEWKEIFERIYVEQWIGEVNCQWCGLSCMEDPPPQLCPFCICPTNVKLSDEDQDLICLLTAEG